MEDTREQDPVRDAQPDSSQSRSSADATPGATVPHGDAAADSHVSAVSGQCEFKPDTTQAPASADRIGITFRLTTPKAFVGFSSTLGLTEAERQRLDAAQQPGWEPPPPPPRSKPVTESLRRVATVCAMAKAENLESISSGMIGDVYLQIGWRTTGSGNNHIGDQLGLKGLQLPKSPGPNGASLFKLPDCSIEEHMRRLGFAI